MHVGSVGVAQEPGAGAVAAGVGQARGSGVPARVGEGAAVGVAEGASAGPTGKTLGGADGDAAGVGVAVAGGGATAAGRVAVPLHDCLEGHERRHHDDHPGQCRYSHPDPHERPPYGPDGAEDRERAAQAASGLLGAPGGEGASVAQVELREHVRDVVLDRVAAEPEASADLGVRSAVAQCVEHAPFGRRQHVGIARPATTVAVHGAMLEQRAGRLPHPTTRRRVAPPSPTQCTAARRDLLRRTQGFIVQSRAGR